MAEFSDSSATTPETLEAILNELDILISLANDGKDFNEDRMDVLIEMRNAHPVYIQKIIDEKLLFRVQLEQFLSSSLDMTRSFVPVNIFESSITTLIEMGFSSELSKRLLEKKCLWMTRMSDVEISKLHEADLYNRFTVNANGLDIIEVAAIFASTPDAFPNDPTGKKNGWLHEIELLLKRMLAEKNKGLLPKHLKRAPQYSTMPSNITGPIEDRDTVRDCAGTVVGSKANKRPSFLAVCKQNSILSKMNSGSLSGPTTESIEEKENVEDII